jgi:hypothetical protein
MSGVLGAIFLALDGGVAGSLSHPMAEESLSGVALTLE